MCMHSYVCIFVCVHAVCMYRLLCVCECEHECVYMILREYLCVSVCI